MTGKKFWEIIKLAYKPPHILLFVGFIVFFISIEDKTLEFLSFLKKLILVSLIILPISGGIMLLNKTNDIEEDKLKGRVNVFTSERVEQKEGFIISFFLYLISSVSTLFLSISKRKLVILPFLVFGITTWLYSDKKYLGNAIGFRLKEHYLGETFAYVISFSFFTTSIWLSFGQLSLKFLVILVSITSLGLFSLFIKDIKDISTDEEAGLETIAYKFELKTLLKTSFLFFNSYLLVILVSSLVGILKKQYLILVLSLILILKSLLGFLDSNWDIGEIKKIDIRFISLALYSSFILLFLISLI